MFKVNGDFTSSFLLQSTVKSHHIKTDSSHTCTTVHYEIYHVFTHQLLLVSLVFPADWANNVLVVLP